MSTQRPDRRARWRPGGWAIAAVGLVAGLLGIGIMLSPVIADDPVVTWPQAGEEPMSTVLPLSPYRPLRLSATVPCAALRSLPDGGEALRTMPSDVGAAPGDGLTVAVTGGRLLVTASARTLHSEPVPAGDCGYRVAADSAGVRLYRDTGLVADQPGLIVPQVAQLVTDASGPASAGLAVTLHTDARYQSTPTALKLALLGAHALALTALLVLALRRWPGRGPGLARIRPSAPDAVVVVVSLAWAVLGPVNIDDSWYLMMARNAEDSGYVGNYIYQFNVTENPFSLSQYAMQLWSAIGGWGVLWIRLLMVIFGLATWVLLRLLLATALGRAHGLRAGRLRLAPWALLAAHLLWWLAYGITLRPEPLIPAGTAAVMLLVELALRRESIALLAAATAVAALTTTVSPTALVAAAPLALAVPWLLRWLASAGWADRLGAAALAAAAASIVIPVGFADASLGDVIEATRVHRWYYRQHLWYEEFVHYQQLLTGNDVGAWGKRAPVLLSFAVLVGAVVALGRRAGTGGPVQRLLLSSALMTALSLATMALTPTKWVIHFGAVAAPATVLLAAAMLRSPLPRRVGVGATGLVTVITVLAAAVTFAGPNMWRPFGDWGQPFGNHLLVNGTPYERTLMAPHIGPVYLRNPLLWLAVAGLAVGYGRWRRRRGLPSGMAPERGVLIAAAGVAVALFLVVFTVAPIRQYPGWSVALSNLRSVTADGCGLASHVQVLAESGTRLGAPVGRAVLTGDMRAGPLPSSPRPPGTAADTEVWHTELPDGSGTGSVTTAWYPLPAGIGDRHYVVVAVAGALALDKMLSQRIEAQFERASGDVEPIALQPRPMDTEWTDVPVPLPAGQPARVRLVVEDRLSSPGDWLAVAEPRLAEQQPITALTTGQPVFADQASAAFWPCVDLVAVADGLVEPPALWLRSGEGLEGATLANATFDKNGGTLTQVDRTAEFVELPSVLDPAGVPTLQWGHVERLVYDHPVGLFDMQVNRAQRAGWTRLPTLIGEPYTGRTYLG